MAKRKRDNTDQITVAEISNPKGLGYNLTWRRKDKLRALDMDAGTLVIEKVPAWTVDEAGAFGHMFVVRNVTSAWRVAVVVPLMRGINVHPHGKDADDRDMELVVLPLPMVEPGETFGLFFAGTSMTVRSAIRLYVAPDDDDDEPTDEPADEPTDEPTDDDVEPSGGCCAAACEQGQALDLAIKAIERDVLAPVQEALTGMSFPPSFSDILRLAQIAPSMIDLVPIAEEHAATVREVRDELLAMCEEEEEEEPVDPGDDDDDDDDEEEEPTDVEPKIHVLPPGFSAVQSWPIVDEREFEVFVDAGKDEVVIKYARLDEDNWPGFVIGFLNEEGEPVELHHGNAWFVHADDDGEPAEWLRRERERNETAFPITTLEGGRPRPGDRVGIFLAGPSRHLSNPSPAMRHRTGMRFYTWRDDGKLTPIE